MLTYFSRTDRFSGLYLQNEKTKDTSSLQQKNNDVAISQLPMDQDHAVLNSVFCFVFVIIAGALLRDIMLSNSSIDLS